MGKALLVLTSKAVRDKAHTWIDKAPDGSRVEFRGPQRTLPQNDRQWALLTCVSTQLKWDGERLSTDEWKDIFMAAYKGEKIIGGIDGKPVRVGRSTAGLDPIEHSEFQTVIEVFCASHDVDIEPVKTKYGPRE